ncbi:hypothetical protein NPIL_181001 [Nephila pilipes]|uniref:Uncharacterized protein n=1 Tax=Nephila pilipes TaxID=299642 RepID=A0A8X6P344_NEPPI|nr:hypothetical protein NPIL_181001 [Nephila pilipes]
MSRTNDLFHHIDVNNAVNINYSAFVILGQVKTNEPGTASQNPAPSTVSGAPYAHGGYAEQPVGIRWSSSSLKYAGLGGAGFGYAGYGRPVRIAGGRGNLGYGGSSVLGGLGYARYGY